LSATKSRYAPYRIYGLVARLLLPRISLEYIYYSNLFNYSFPYRKTYCRRIIYTPPAGFSYAPRTSSRSRMIIPFETFLLSRI